MRIPRIYQQGDINIGDELDIERAATHHLTRVLRLRQDASIIVFNGQGGEYLGHINIQGKKASFIPDTFSDPQRESTLDICLLQGISKGDRMDLSIQKAVELGVNSIVPVFCHRTVVNLKDDRMEKKLNHWRSIAVSACEQSGRNIIPEIKAPVTVDELCNSKPPGIKLTMDPEAGVKLSTLQATGQKISLLIGPEGGLSDAEIDQAKSAGFQGIQLGPRVLRTETAALATIAALQTQWGDFK